MHEVVGTGQSSAAPKPAGATPEAACAYACAVCMQVVVDLADEAFQSPRKQVGPHYSQQEAQRLADAKGWTVAPDGDSYRRVVASPLPLDIVEAGPINTLLQVSAVHVYCCRCVVAWEVTAWEVRCTNHALPAHCQLGWPQPRSPLLLCPAGPPRRRLASSPCAVEAEASLCLSTVPAGRSGVWRRWWTRMRVRGCGLSLACPATA